MIKSIMPSLSNTMPLKNVSFDHDNQDETKNAILEFSKMFLTSILKQMFNEDENSSLYGDSYGGQMWKSLYIEEIAKLSAHSIGISDMIEKSISKKINPYQKQATTSSQSTKEVFA
ncbi:MAG: rod-binding protein [Proteobacteria bacterium]|nr:rod-binding protein [Pseudomonadota bacterium]